MKNNTIAVLEITDTHVKLIEAKAQGGGFVITRSLAQEAANNAEKVFEQLLSSSLSAKGPKRDEYFVVIPRRSVFLKQMSFPSHSEEEIKKMMGLQLSNHVPYPREDIISDYRLLEKIQGGYTKALVAVTSKRLVNRYVQIMHKKGVHSFKFVIGAFGIQDWFISQERKNKQQASVPTVLLNVDYGCSELCFYHEKKLLYSRNISFGTKALESDTSGFVSQIMLTMEAYQTENMGAPVQRIAIISDAPKAALLKESLEQCCDIPVDILSPGQDIACEKTVDIAGLQATQGVSLASGLGFIFQETPRHMNFIPREVFDTRKGNLRKKVVVRFILAFCLMVVLAASSLGVGIRQKKQYLEKIQDEIKRVEIGGERAEQKIRFFNFIKDTIQGRVLVVDVVKELYKITPQEISFRSLQFDRQGALIIQGFADTGSSVNNFQTQLVSSSLFKEVTLQYATKRKKFKEEYTDFKIICKIVK